MAKVTFRFEEGEPVVTYATEGERLLEVAQKSNVPIDAPCSGNASCGKCRVRLVSGELDSKITRHISEEEYQNGWRLACVSTVKGDVEVEVPDIASAYRSRMKVADLSSPSEIAIFEDTKKKITDAGLELKNSMQVIKISMEEPTLDDTMPDNERVTWAVQAATGLERVRIPYSVLKKMPDVLRESHFQAQCVVRVTANDVLRYASNGSKSSGRWSRCRHRNNDSFCTDRGYAERRNPGKSLFRKRTDPVWCGCYQPYH